MGYLQDGEWQRAAAARRRRGTGGSRGQTACIRNWITRDGAPGPSGRGGFAAESGRYHLYVSLRLPLGAPDADLPRAEGAGGARHRSTWCIRSSGADGWTFDTGFPRRHRRPGARQARSCARSISPPIRRRPARVTVPVLWDKATGTIVSNESAEIIRMFNSAFDRITGNGLDFWPEPLRPEIEAVNDAGLCRAQQRRLSRRLRPDPGGLRRGGGGGLRDARLARGAAGAAAAT